MQLPGHMTRDSPFFACDMQPSFGLPCLACEDSEPTAGKILRVVLARSRRLSHLSLGLLLLRVGLFLKRSIILIIILAYYYYFNYVWGGHMHISASPFGSQRCRVPLGLVLQAVVRQAGAGN